MKNAIVSISILGANQDNIDHEIDHIKEAHVKWVHFDVMDGCFVKNKSFDKPFLKSVCEKIDVIKDVHIMINDPLIHVIDYVDCGTDYLTFHYEACKDDSEVREVIKKIHSLNIKAGLSIKPNTPVDVVFPFLDELDLVLIMSVEPGYGGQKFINASLDKIVSLRNNIDEKGLATLISVDGGINDKTAPLCLDAGVNVLVIGQYLFGHEDFLERYKRII